MRQKIEFVVAVLLFVGLLIISQNVSKQVAVVKTKDEKKLVILDSGHGGKDPGKVGVNGVLEKDINLAIAKLVKKNLDEQGVEVLMMRETDQMLSDENAENKKLEDMKARVSFINQNLPVLTVSIHQNSYQDAAVSGAQVFYYSGSAEGKKAAEILQKNLLEIDEDNKRQAKGNDDYYLLMHTEVPVIIVECGFLSNPEEADLLVSAEYQEILAEAICKGILEYLGIK